jgi:flagellar motility protein MotE (MotC chaperone)
MEQNGPWIFALTLIAGILGKKYIWAFITELIKKPSADDDFKQHLKNELINERARHDQQLRDQHQQHLKEINHERERLVDLQKKLTKHVSQKSRGKK